MSFSAELRDRTASTWRAAVAHRFVDELWAGRVEPGVLRTYLVQDHQFVDAFIAPIGEAAIDAETVRVVARRGTTRIVENRQGLVLAAAGAAAPGT